MDCTVMRRDADVRRAISAVLVEPIKLLVLMKNGDRFKARVPHPRIVFVALACRLFDALGVPFTSAVTARDHIEGDITVQQVPIALDESDVLIEVDGTTSRPGAVGSAVCHDLDHDRASRTGFRD